MMKYFIVLILTLASCSISNGYKRDHGLGYLFKHDPNLAEREKAEKLVNDKIRSVFTRFGNTTVFRDPLLVGNVQTKFSGTTMSFSGLRLYGLARFRPLQIRSDFTNLMISMTLSMDQLNLLGSFQMTPWVTSTPGRFNFTIGDAWLSLEAQLAIQNEGFPEETIKVEQILPAKLTYDELQLGFEDMGVLSTMLQPLRATLSRYIYGEIKSVLCREGETSFARVLEKVLDKLPLQVPQAVNAVDRALIRARSSMKASQLDPLDIPDYYPKSNKLFKLELTQGKLFGLSSIKRIGPILVGFESDAVHMLLNLGVTDLKGQYLWTFMLWKNLLSNRGFIQYKVQDVAVQVKLEKRLTSQENSTKIESIQMKIGSVSLLSEGFGAVRYIMETFLNVVPDAFRQRISDAAEYKLMKVIEEEVQKIDLEEIVQDSSMESQ